MTSDSVVIVGASLAGIRSAKELRSLGFDGAITLIGDEATLPYDRPPLSKQYLAGTITEEDLLLTSTTEVEELDLRLVEGRATAVDLRRRRVQCDGPGEVGYSHLVAATGAHPRRPAWMRDLEGMHQLRTIADAHELRENTASRDHVTIVGGGFIGTEIAATMRSQGKRVTLVVDTPYLLDTLGAVVGARFTRFFRDRGVEVLTRTAVMDAVGDTRVEALRMSDGTLLESDSVIVAVGAVPTSDWLGGAPSRSNLPVVVDENSRAGERFWAAGDVTGGGHWYAALRQARLAARSILGVEDRKTRRLADEVPYVWTDQFELKVQALGRPGGAGDWHPLPGHDLEDLGSTGVSGLYAHRGAVTGGILVDRPQDMATLRRHIVGASPVDTALDDLGALARS